MSGGGIFIPSSPAAELSGVGRILVFAEQGSPNTSAASGAISDLAIPFRPPQWSVGIPAMTMLTIPAQYVQSTNSQQSTVGAVTNLSPVSSTPPNAVPQYLVFDGVMRISHSQPMIATEHPVQTTANLSDHIRATQAMITMDVLMTDVLPAYAAGQWVGNQSKSVACFQTLDNLRLNRIPLILTTRLKTYSPVFILNVMPDETVKTRYGFRGRIEFKQLNLFSIATQTVSARVQTTGSTSQGQTNPQPVPAGVTSQNGIPNAAQLQGETGTMIAPGTFQNPIGVVVGAGNYSSNPASAIPGVN